MREVLSLGAFIIKAAVSCGVRNHAKARRHQNNPCAGQTGVLQ
jgi:hypothetical protein